jgi:hypothetical protein
MKKTGLLLISVSVLLVSGCWWKKNRLNIDVSGIHVKEIVIHRYDIDLFKIPPGDLAEGLRSIQKEYPFFLGNGLYDSLKLAGMKAYLTNPRNIDFHKTCEEKFRDLKPIEKELTDAFRHYKYYFPDARIPRIYSYISGGDYDNPVVVSDSVMIIALDTYLGKDFQPYLSDGVPVYRTDRMTPEHVVTDCMNALIYSRYPANPSAMMLLDKMVEAGKHLYLLDAFLPDYPDSLKMDYTVGQEQWIIKNEVHVWAAIIENRMLYSTDGHNIRVFLSDGPFTPEFSNQSPPRLGEWIGRSIIRAYMNRYPKITLQQLMEEKDAQKILTLSYYKPGR